MRVIDLILAVICYVGGVYTLYVAAILLAGQGVGAVLLLVVGIVAISLGVSLVAIRSA